MYDSGVGGGGVGGTGDGVAMGEPKGEGGGAGVGVTGPSLKTCVVRKSQVHERQWAVGRVVSVGHMPLLIHATMFPVGLLKIPIKTYHKKQFRLFWRRRGSRREEGRDTKYAPLGRTTSSPPSGQISIQRQGNP